MSCSNEQLRLNRIEHVRAVRSKKNYLGDIKTTVNGKEVSIARGAIAIDGAGNTRAYNHLIRGN